MYQKLEKKIGIHFKDQKLLQNAFIHRSYLNEHKDFAMQSNERLEFLGDAVLQKVVTELLYSHYSNPEGELTNWRSALVKGETLAKVSRQFDLGDYLFLSKGEEASGGRGKDYLLANAFEALIAVIYLEHGERKVTSFVKKNLFALLEKILKTGAHIDSKSRFQELAQEKLLVTPKYELLHDEGPDHEKMFTMGAYLGSRLAGKGTGASKQSAEQKAAEDALIRLKW